MGVERPTLGSDGLNAFRLQQGQEAFADQFQTVQPGHQSMGIPAAGLG